MRPSIPAIRAYRALPIGYAPCVVVRVRHLWFVLVAFALLASPAAADEPPPRADTSDRAEARRYFEAGNQAYNAGQYAVAARAFEEAHRRAPLPEITFSTAQAYRLAYYQQQDRNLETLRRALELYSRYLSEAPRGKRRSHATMHIEAIEKLLGSQSTAAPPPEDAPPDAEAKPKQTPPPATELLVTSRTPGARGRIDQSELYEIPFSLAVSPGRHEISVEAPGHEPVTIEWLAIEHRLVVAQVQLEPRPAKLRVIAPPGAGISVNNRAVGTAPLRTPVDVEPGPNVVRVTQRGRLPLTRHERIERGQTVTIDAQNLDLTDQRVIAHFTLGGAAVLALAGTTTAILAVAAENRVKDYDASRGQGPKSGDELAERNADLEARDDLRTASYVLLGSAVAVGATGALLWFLDTPGSETRATGIRPLVGRDMVGLGWAGSH
jgi:tetratricopeptide (TPR) repeat protein